MLESMLNLNGIKKYIYDNYSIFLFEKFTQDIMNAIKEQLSVICYGPNNAYSGEFMYNYESALKEFVKRIDNKDAKTRYGMIGEILVHLIIRCYFEEYSIITPFFNMEERSIKKGYDIVLSDKSGKNFWILEVKSGTLHKNKDVNGTICDLIDDAKNDLRQRLNSENYSLWLEAINNAKIALDNTSAKKAIIKLLINQGNDASKGIYKSNDKNVFLSSVIFADFNDIIKNEVIKNKQDIINKKGIFNSVYIVSIQESTADNVYNYIKSELENLSD